MAIELRRVAKDYPGGVSALTGLDLALAPGELLTVLGPSGSGKSTLLRLVAGLERPSTGEVWIDGRPADRLPPWRRDAAMAFQQPAVYPFLKVADNLAFGLRARKVPRAERRLRVREVAERLGLAALLDRAPETLSGGERQRVALGRALARRPSILLLDEPFSSLDAPLRAALRADLAGLHRSYGPTTLHATHDQAEALALGDLVAVLRAGRLEQVGPPREVHDRPASLFVAEFVGSPPMSVIACVVAASEGRLTIGPAGRGPSEHVALEGPSFDVPRRRGPGPVLLGLRPEQVGADRSGPAIGALAVAAVLRRLEYLGPGSLATFDLGPEAGAVRARLGPGSPMGVGERHALRLALDGASWFDPRTGRRLD